jgi:arginine decarboxylase
MTLDASIRPSASPIVRVLNEEVRHYHRWCTPSTLVDQERIEDFYASDVSISAGFFGTLVDHTGVFGEAERFAAAAQGADRTMFSVHGSTGSNFVVLRMLALERPDALILVARNCHHSTINAIKAYGLGFRFLPSPYDPEFEAVLPPSVDQVLEGLRRYPEALAVVYTSPTYEGLCANTHAIAAAVHDASDHAMLFVDEAWGGHLHFHPELPPSAIDVGADIAVQSTHKLAGGLQQTGLIHWREGRVDSELMEEAFREYVTTSPSYHLLASADAAVRSLAATGREALGACISRTRTFKARLRERLPLLRHLDDPAWVGRHYAHVAGCDKVKTTVALSGYSLSGFAVSQALVERGIVIEKAGVNTITLITTFQLEEAAVEATVRALEEVLAGHELPDGEEKRMPANPFRAIDDRPVMHPYHARRYAKSIGQEVPLDQAVGRGGGGGGGGWAPR